MSIFKSRYARTRAYVDAFAGDSDDPRWRTPAAAAATLAAVLAGAESWPGQCPPHDDAGGIDVAGGTAEAGWDEAPAAWGEDWDAGWGSDESASQALD